MKHQLFKIIDELADKSLTFGCRVMAHPDAKDPNVYIVTHRHGNFFECLDRNGDHDCACSFGQNSGLQILGHPVRIGDVLEALAKKESKTPDYSLLQAWTNLDYSKSLQEIFDCEWRLFAECECGEYYPLPASPFYQEHCERHRYTEKQEPKDPAKRALAELLIQLFS